MPKISPVRRFGSMGLLTQRGPEGFEVNPFVRVYRTMKTRGKKLHEGTEGKFIG